jgi:hypothetical protein
MGINVHKVFVSYHHANDQKYRDDFENILASSGISIIKSVQIGDIDENLSAETIRQRIRDEYLRDSTVTVVLVGTQTWQRKHVDWEIGSSLRDTQLNSRSGILGILLPTHSSCYKNTYDPHTIPPRLYDNVKCGFAKVYNWTTSPLSLESMIHDAFEGRYKIKPDNSRPSFKINHSGAQWY